MIEIVAIRSYF